MGGARYLEIDANREWGTEKDSNTQYSILPTWQIMASKLKGTSLQHFSEEKLTRWRERLQHVTKGMVINIISGLFLDRFLYAGSGTQNDLEEIFEDVFQSRSQQEQLKAIKKVILKIKSVHFLLPIV